MWVQDWFDCEALTEPGNREYQTWAVTGSLSASEHPLAMVFGPTTDLYVKRSKNAQRQEQIEVP